MQLFGLDVRRVRTKDAGTLAPIDTRGGWLNGVREGFTGAWQRNITIEPPENILKFSAVYACVSLIAGDIAKLRPKLMMPSEQIWIEVQSPAYSPVLRKPNRYQTRIQFFSQWLSSKLLHGNTYVLKERDGNTNVAAMYVLDPRRVTPLVASDGSVYYRLANDQLAEIAPDGAVVPASEIIHDRGVCFFHPLTGISPIYACGMSTTQGLKIQANSALFFENMSRPSGLLTAPGKIPDEIAQRLKRDWEKNFSGNNIGRLAVLGDGLKYDAMTIPATDAQLIEQLRWTVEDVSRCFHVPLHKIASGQNPTFSNVGALNQDYYTQTLQLYIEELELMLEEGLGLQSGTTNYSVEFDLDGLLRMDPLSRADANKTAITAGYLAPNEARLKENLGPVEGGDSPLAQQQNYSLAALAKRDASADPFNAAPVQPTASETPPNAQAKKLADILIAKFMQATHAA